MEESEAFDLSPGETRVRKPVKLADNRTVIKSFVYRQYGPKARMLAKSSKIVSHYCGLYQIDDSPAVGKHLNATERTRALSNSRGMPIAATCTPDDKQPRPWSSTASAHHRPTFPIELMSICLGIPREQLVPHAATLVQFKTATAVTLPNGDEASLGDWVLIASGSDGEQLVGTIAEILQIDKSPNAMQGLADFVTIRFADIVGIHGRLFMPLLRMSDRYGLVPVPVRNLQICSLGVGGSRSPLRSYVRTSIAQRMYSTTVRPVDVIRRAPK